MTFQGTQCEILWVVLRVVSALLKMTWLKTVFFYGKKSSIWSEEEKATYLFLHILNFAAKKIGNACLGLFLKICCFFNAKYSSIFKNANTGGTVLLGKNTTTNTRKAHCSLMSHFYGCCSILKDPGHSAKSAGGRLQLNMLTPYVCGFAWSGMVHGCMVYTECAKMAAVSCGASAVSTPLRWIFKNALLKSYSLM